jgi:hypothetical protein
MNFNRVARASRSARFRDRRILCRLEKGLLIVMVVVIGHRSREKNSRDSSRGSE